MQAAKGVLLLILAAVAVGVAYYRVRHNPSPPFCGQPATQLPAARTVPATEPLTITLQEVHAATEGDAVIIDARSPLFFKLGHIPRAINVSRKDFPGDFARVEASLRKATGRRLVVYCDDEDCDDALTVARDLLRAGLAQVHVFMGGWKQWQEAALPEEQD